jgi:hypothetical protein
MTASVGADIEALCSKCGDVWHVVVAKVGDEIVKVHCKECNKEHRYKSPHGSESSKAKRSTPPSPDRAKAPVERFGRPAVAADLSKPVRSYRATEHFEVAERVEHPTFGQGIVEISDDGKITVFFAVGRRVLVQAKTSAGSTGQLTRPKPFDYSNAAGGKRVSET